MIERSNKEGKFVVVAGETNVIQTGLLVQFLRDNGQKVVEFECPYYTPQPWELEEFLAESGWIVAANYTGPCNPDLAIVLGANGSSRLDLKNYNWEFVDTSRSLQEISDSVREIIKKMLFL